MKTQILTGSPVLVSLKPLDLSTCTKQDILDYFQNTYDLYETLFTSLNDDNVFYMCPDRLRLPLIFYYAHTAVVYVNKLMLAGLLKERINMEFETMFETGVDEMSWDDTENYRMGGSYKWPSIQTVVEYRQQVRNIIIKIIQETPLQLPITMDSPWWAMLMGFEHDRIHLETSSVLIRQLPVDIVTKPSGWTYGPLKNGQRLNDNPMVEMADMDVTLGKPEDFPSYGWDNEYGCLKSSVPAFESSKYPITHGQFLEFVKSGGYNKRELWTEDGWQWKEFKKAKHPPFWVCSEGCKSNCGANLSVYSHCKSASGEDISIHCGYRYRAMFDELDLPMDWPVEVTYHEAKAYCAWKGPEFRLPAEAERHVMLGTEKPVRNGTSCDIIYQDTIPANLNMQYGSSTPVNLYPANDAGFCDVYGNVGGWHEDHFNGFNGLKTHYLYHDYSTSLCDGKHHVVLGGSWCTTGAAGSRFFRNTFRPHFLTFSGFRVLRNLYQTDNMKLPIRVINNNNMFELGVGETKPVFPLYGENTTLIPTLSANYHFNYDTEESLYRNLQKEFGSSENISHAVTEHCLGLTENHNIYPDKATILGSGVGHLAFLLSEKYNSILGVEICARMVDASLTLQDQRSLSKTDPNGQIHTYRLHSAVDTNRIIFKQLTWIPNEVVASDLVIITHLHRLQNPKAWLIKLWEITKLTGLTVIVSIDNNWTEDQLQPYLSHKFQCIGSEVIQYVCEGLNSKATVTSWKRI